MKSTYKSSSRLQADMASVCKYIMVPSRVPLNSSATKTTRGRARLLQASHELKISMATMQRGGKFNGFTGAPRGRVAFSNGVCCFELGL